MLHAERPAFLPIDRRHALAAGTELPDRAHGAVLFADIAGFTTLSRQLTEVLGLRGGVDRLSVVLEDVYGALVAEVHEAGGSVLGFSGDAITCWFDDAPGALEVATPPSGPRRAVACAHRLIEALEALPSVRVGDDRVPLGIKVAVASGPVVRLVVGDPDLGLVDLVGGDPVSRVADLEHAAGLGEVVVDPATLAAVGGSADAPRSEARPTPSGPGHLLEPGPPTTVTPWVPLSPDAVDPAVAEAFVAASLRGRLGDLTTELRPTVSLFLQFTPLALDAPDGAETLDALVRWVQAVLAPLDGTLLQVTIGDKSGYLYAAFGTPHAHEDIAARAAGAALTLRDLPEHLAAAGPVRIGLAEGMARTGVYGSDASLTFGALGDGTNLAARLMSLADPGTVLMARTAATACGAGFRTTAHDPVAAKGFAEVVPVVVLESRLAYLAPEISHRRQLVGREVELATLVDRLGLVVSGGAGIVAVAGDAGMGKSHLVAEAKRRLGDVHDVTWVAARADERTAGPLAPFAEALGDLTYQGLATEAVARRDLFDAAIDNLIAECRAADAGAGAADRLEEGRSFLGSLLGLSWEGSRFELHDDRTRLDRILVAMVDLLVAMSATRPVVVHVADAQWLDEVSWRLLAAIGEAGTTGRLVLLLDERTEAGRPPIAGEVLAGATIIELRPLTTAGVAALVAALLGGEPDEAFVAEIDERTEGAPLFVEQLLGDLLDRGAIEVGSDGRLRIDPSVGRQLPVNLSTLLVSRLDRLDPASLDVVQRAAILGRTFELDALGGIVGPEVDLIGALRDAERSGICEEDPAVAGRWSFRHALLREVAYETQTEERRRDAHGAALSALESVGSHPTVLAHHAERAGEHRVAMGHLASAATAARRMSAPSAAVEHLERAVDLARLVGGAAEERGLLLGDLGKACSAAGRHHQASTAYGEALDVVAEPTDRLGLLVGLGDALARCGDLESATAAYEEGIAVLQVAPDASAASRLYAGLALVAVEAGDLAAAADLAEVSEELLSHEEDPSARARAAHRRAVIALRRGLVEEAAAHVEVEQAAADASGRPEDAAAASLMAGRLLVAAGRLDEASEVLEAACDGFERCGDEHGLARALDELGAVLHRRGRRSDSEACVERAAALLAGIALVDGQLFGTLWRSGAW